MAFVVDDAIYLYIAAAMAAASAAAQNYASTKAVEVQSDAAVKTTVENYKASSEQERLANLDAEEKLTDRMRDAKRQLSAARVFAAEGGGGLQARSDNILSGLTEDSSRIVAGLDATHGAIRQDQRAAQVSGESAQAGFQSQAAAARTKLVTDLAQIAVSTYGSSVRKTSEVNTAKGWTADYSLPKQRNYLRGNT